MIVMVTVVKVKIVMIAKVIFLGFVVIVTIATGK